ALFGRVSPTLARLSLVRREPSAVVLHTGALTTPRCRTLFPLNQLVTNSDNPSCRYRPPRFCLSTCGRAAPYKDRNALLSEPIVSCHRVSRVVYIKRPFLIDRFWIEKYLFFSACFSPFASSISHFLNFKLLVE